MYLNLRDKNRDIVELRETLERRLSRYGLRPALLEPWEVHGPHGSDMPFPVYIGWTYYLKSRKPSGCVAIYPNAVYEVGSPSDWYKTNSSTRLHTTKWLKQFDLI